jgi:hypothetical protein
MRIERIIAAGFITAGSYVASYTPGDITKFSIGVGLMYVGLTLFLNNPDNINTPRKALLHRWR